MTLQAIWFGENCHSEEHDNIYKELLQKLQGQKINFKKVKTYFVQIRAFAKEYDGNKVYGVWSARKKVMIRKNTIDII